MLILTFLIAHVIAGGPSSAAYQLPHPIPDHFSEKRQIPDLDMKTDSSSKAGHVFDKKAVRSLLPPTTLINIRESGFDLLSGGRRFHVETTIDVPLQKFILNRMDTSTAAYMGIVAMDPYTGKVLSMVGFDKKDPLNNPCTDSRFPAASVFKMVTAAAAIETCGLDSESEMTYRGRKHTLYKSQLKKQPDVHKITLRDSFAQSINPVFGKMGIHDLGKVLLEKYARAFGFNRNISFEIPLAPSTMAVSDETYHWAEIASGFNRETMISPLHGALMASVALNRGRLIEPVIIDQIINGKGQILYRGHLTSLNQAISPQASSVITDLMEATIESGTCKKMFRGYQSDDILSKLSIGGKTGTINSRTRENYRYDWFVGFASEKDGSERIVISAVIAHEKYIGKRAAQYARMVIRRYFSDYFENTGRKQVSGIRK